MKQRKRYKFHAIANLVLHLSFLEKEIPRSFALLLEKVTEVNTNIAGVQLHIIETNYHHLSNEHKWITLVISSECLLSTILTELHKGALSSSLAYWVAVTYLADISWSDLSDTSCTLSLQQCSCREEHLKRHRRQPLSCSSRDLDHMQLLGTLERSFFLLNFCIICFALIRHLLVLPLPFTAFKWMGTITLYINTHKKLI